MTVYKNSNNTALVLHILPVYCIFQHKTNNKSIAHANGSAAHILFHKQTRPPTVQLCLQIGFK